MSVHDRERWNAKYAARLHAPLAAPDDWLIQSVAARVPGRALDLACGTGHNALWLASRGWSVDALDVSDLGLQIAQLHATSQGLRVNWQLRDLEDWSAELSTFDLICVFRYLDRQRFPREIPRALRPGGLFVCECLLQPGQASSTAEAHNPAYHLEPGELVRLYAESLTIRYAEESTERQPPTARLCAELPIISGFVQQMP